MDHTRVLHTLARENKIVNTFLELYYLYEVLTALFLPSFYSPTAPNAIYSHSKCYLLSLQMLSILTTFYVTIYELLNIFFSGSHSKQLTQIIHYTTEPLLTPSKPLEGLHLF